MAREIITNESGRVIEEKPLAPKKTLKKEMDKIIKEQLPKLSEIVFSLNAPDANEVHLVGDFNSWQPNETSRMERSNGAWIKKVSLKSGRYQYRFVVDGSWTEDAGNPRLEANPFGQMNSLVEIQEGS